MAAVPTETKSMTLGADTPTSVTPTSGKFLTSVSPSIDTSIIKAENIAQGVTILGILGTHQGGGGSLQSKSVTYTENGTAIVTPDTGYDGLSSVQVTTAVSGGTGGGEYNIAQVYDEDGNAALAILTAPNNTGAYNIVLTISGDTCTLASGVAGLNGLPIDVYTDAEMTAALTLANAGKSYRFLGTSDVYTNGDLYMVEAVDS